MATFSGASSMGVAVMRAWWKLPDLMLHKTSMEALNLTRHVLLRRLVYVYRLACSMEAE
jgi:hypothetical protein